MRKEKGITLVSLILTVAVLIIIVAVSVNVGSNSLDSTRLKGFYMQLEIVQKRVDDIAATNESYIDEDGDTIFLKEQGKSFDGMEEKQQEILTDIIESVGGDVLTGYIANFRYFTTQEVETVLGISDIDYNLFIDFENRTIIAEEGIEIDGIKYHMLESTVYNIKNNLNKNVGNIDFSITVSKYGSNKYKLTIIPSENIGDLQGTGIIKYKEINTNYWDTSNKMEIIVDDISKYYDIIYQDTNGNKSLQKTVGIVLDESGKGATAEVIKIYTSDQLMAIAIEARMRLASKDTNIKDNKTFSLFGDFIQTNQKTIVPEKKYYATNPTSEEGNITRIYVLMNNLDLKLEEYWNPIGDVKILEGIFDGNDKKITITYTDDHGGEYIIVYDESNNFKEESYKVNIVPKFEDGTIAKNAVVSITYPDGNIIEKRNGETGEETIEILLKRETEVVVEAWIETNKQIASAPISFKIDNPNNVKDICPILKNGIITFTINPTPSDATVTINGENRKSITVLYGTTINWKVSKIGYQTKTNTVTVNQNTTENVILEQDMVTITINPTPSDATVTINGENKKTINVQAGTTINWTVSKTGYITQSGTYTANSNDTQTIPVTLSGKMVTFTVNPTPSDATVTINGQTTKSLQVMEGSNVTWSVNKTYYYGQSGTYTIGTSNYTQAVTLSAKPTQTLTLAPGGVDGRYVDNLNNAIKDHNNTDSYAGGNSIIAISPWLWWEFLASDIQKTIKSDDYKIKSLSVQYRIYGTVNTEASVTLYVDSNEDGVANAFSSTTIKSGALSKKLFTYSLDESSVPSASRIRKGVNLKVAYSSGKSTLPRWYGATLTIQYVEP